MSKPDKISIETKKGTCYYNGGACSKVRIGSHGTEDLLLIGAANKDREGRQRQRRQTKTEKAKKTDGSVQRCPYPATAGGQLLYKESARNTSSRHFGLLQYLSVSGPVKRCLCSMERVPCQSRIFFQNYTSV